MNSQNSGNNSALTEQVDWPAVVAGVNIYGEWGSPPLETSIITSGYVTTEITSKYLLSRMMVVPQTFADFTARFRPQLAVKHFNHTACGGRTHVSTSAMMTWVHTMIRSVVLRMRLHFLSESAASADVGEVGLTPMLPATLKPWWGLLVSYKHGLSAMAPDMLKSACIRICMAQFMLH